MSEICRGLWLERRQETQSRLRKKRRAESEGRSFSIFELQSTWRQNLGFGAIHVIELLQPLFTRCEMVCKTKSWIELGFDSTN